jgi:hypothetical protein
VCLETTRQPTPRNCALGALPVLAAFPGPQANKLSWPDGSFPELRTSDEWSWLKKPDHVRTRQIIPDSYCLAETTLVTYALMAFPKLQDVRWRHCLLKLCSISNEDTSRLTPPCYHISIGTLMQFVSNMIIRKHPGMTWVCIYMQMGVHFTYVHRCWVAIFSVWTFLWCFGALNLWSGRWITFEKPNQLESPRNENARSLSFQCPQVICSEFACQSILSIDKLYIIQHYKIPCYSFICYISTSCAEGFDESMMIQQLRNEKTT